ncbi:MAG: PD40 domain-containing protein [Chloroflexi bacterium]|nr:PD40 domain-containing protein [Chloroflexota bacterium]
MKALSRSIILLFILMVTLSIASTAFAATPTGTSPNDALMVPTGTQTIASNTTLWFYFDYAVSNSSGPGRPSGGPGGAPVGSKSNAKATVTVDANGAKDLQFAVYTPDQAKSWLSDVKTEPVGRGTPYVDALTDSVTHDLYWAGAFNTSGIYMIAVTNSSSKAISFRMTVTGESVSLYPAATATPTEKLYVPITVTPISTTTFQGKIVFETATGGEIYTVNGDGTNLTKVSHGIDPSWSPDGKQIVFARWDNTAPGIYIANADGSNERIIFTTPRARWPRFSPDGKSIVFSQDKTKDDRNIIWKLGLVEIATGKLSEPQCSQLCFVPSWQTDSTTIVYTDPGVGIMSTSINGGSALLVLGPSGKYWDSTKNAAMPILYMPPIQDSEVSPAGNQIAFAQQAHDRWEVNVVNADGSNRAAVTSPDPVTSFLLDTVVHNVAPTWSSDSKQILFLSDRNGKWEIFVAAADGTNVRQVLKNVTDIVSIKFTYENERMMDWTN